MQRIDFESPVVTKNSVRALKEKTTAQSAGQHGISVGDAG
jgi:hypothetical protein